MRTVDSILQELEQEAATTRRVLERVPEDKLSWKPHEKSMTLGRLALHVATAPGGVARFIREDTYDLSGYTPAPDVKRTSELLAALDQSIAEAKEVLNTFDDRKLMASWNLTRDGEVVLTMSRMAVIRTILLNHVYHHRGQLSVYLRLLNIPVPAIYGPSADENPPGSDR